MGYGVSLHVTGDYALFTRPEMKAERVSYDVITPSAARGILEAIYWHPGLRWHIDRITVLKPIVFDSVRRNELGGKMSVSAIKSAMKDSGRALPQQLIQKDRQQRASLLLRDVGYIIDAHFILCKEQLTDDDTPEKFYNIFLRRARQGQCFSQPYLGCREFPAAFRLLEAEAPRPESCYAQEERRDLGWMLWDMDYQAQDCPARFFRASMEHGVIIVPEEADL
jgi:CRISPR-associated protein Cas5 subtype I-C